MPDTTILIVDDEKGPRESLRMILSNDHEVLTCDSGVEALEILGSTEVDLVTVDLNMPGMKGEELLRLIREESPQIEMIVITGFGSVESAIDGIRYGVFDYLTKPFDIVQVTGAVRRALERRQSRTRLVQFLEGVGSVLGRDAESESMLSQLEASYDARERLRSVIEEPALDGSRQRTRASWEQSVEFLEVLAETIENRDEYMRGHARRVAYYGGLIAERLCLSATERELVRISAFLHDLGKVGVPLDIVSSPGQLLPRQREKMQLHSSVGERLLKPLGFSSRICTSIRHHHERWDGGGYPDGLVGADIPLASRIIAIADAFDAMTCERPYRARLSIEEASQELRKFAGSQFDPHLVEEFNQVIDTGAVDCIDDRSLQRLEDLQELAGAGEFL